MPTTLPSAATESQSYRPGLLHGVYAYREAARLLGVSSQRVARWADGYVFPLKIGYGASGPVLQTDRRKGVVSFYELIELFFVREYVALGVRLPHIRETASSLVPQFGPYPFSTAPIIVNGRELIVQRAAQILQRPDVGQLVADFAAEISKDIAFRHDVAARYCPPEFHGRVYLDKEIHAGEPVVTAYAVPTRSIYGLWEQEHDIATVAEYYDIETDAVSTAIRYEGQWRIAA